MSSWYDAWADRYGDWSTSVTADVPFYVGLARDADGPLVELAVGNGRVAIPVAQATGRRVIGIDSSPAMLAQAREGRPCTLEIQASAARYGRFGSSDRIPAREAAATSSACSSSLRAGLSRRFRGEPAAALDRSDSMIWSPFDSADEGI
jgi:SAM-dependent methyltransferase